MDLASAFMQYVQRCPHVMQSIQGFVGENCHHFADLAVCEERRLEYTTIHQQFLALLEQHVEVQLGEAFLQFQGASESEFLEALQSVQAGTGGCQRGMTKRTKMGCSSIYIYI
ncbi:unnamed protein product [Cladocopium goreaui]|uniref:Cilia- and flagella-associated protein 36 (Coiled-coil domain-containing protein 104) n=1 Tax=Cladocopium goreaui TaxID=2562237 RepID=A0A9P1M4M0_9DINO|nr:unnamed protein product [Cladocopium goreaui]